MFLYLLPRDRFVLAVAALVAIIVSMQTQSALGRASKLDAAVLRAVAMKYFDAMDWDKTGVLTQREISFALKKHYIDPPDVEVIKYMRDHMDDVGHVMRVDTFSYATTAGPTVLSVPMPRIVYGISKQDLLDYGLSKEEKKEKEKERDKENKEPHGQA
jgi:hypothetical protein